MNALLASLLILSKGVLGSVWLESQVGICHTSCMERGLKCGKARGNPRAYTCVHSRRRDYRTRRPRHRNRAPRHRLEHSKPLSRQAPPQRQSIQKSTPHQFRRRQRPTHRASQAVHSVLHSGPEFNRRRSRRPSHRLRNHARHGKSWYKPEQRKTVMTPEATTTSRIMTTTTTSRSIATATPTLPTTAASRACPKGKAFAKVAVKKSNFNDACHWWCHKAGFECRNCLATDPKRCPTSRKTTDLTFCCIGNKNECECIKRPRTTYGLPNDMSSKDVIDEVKQRMFTPHFLQTEHELCTNKCGKLNHECKSPPDKDFACCAATSGELESASDCRALPRKQLISGWKSANEACKRVCDALTTTNGIQFTCIANPATQQGCCAMNGEQECYVP